MDDATNPATEVEFNVTPAESVTHEVETEDVALPSDDTDEISEEGDASDELDDVEYEGKQYKLPKELKEALLRHADYTRKTQEVAATRKEVEAARQQFQQEVQLQQQTLQDRAQLMMIENQLSQFEQIDWTALSDQDPVQAQKLWFQKQQLEQTRGQAATRIHQAQQQAMYQQQEQLAKRVQEGREMLAREIKGWSADTAKQVAEYGKQSGYSEQELGNLYDPRYVKTLHKAMLYDQLMSKATQKPKAEAPVPVPTVKTKSATANRDPDRMSADEWLKWRNSQLRKRA